MATLTDDDLRLPGYQAFNVTPAGVMRPTAPDPNVPPSYGQQMSNVGGALTDLAGAAMRFLFNAPGGGGVLDPNRYSGAPAAAVPPQPAAQAAGGPDRAGGPQPAVTDTPAAAVAKTRPAGTAKASAAAPAQAPGLVPGETGYYLNGALVPYGPDMLVGLPGSNGQVPGAGMLDPRDMFDYMMKAQYRYAERAADDLATKVLQPGGKALMPALAAVYNNGLAGVGMGGINSFNTNTSGMANEQKRAETARANAASVLAGDLAKAQATVQSATIGAAPHTAAVEQREQEFYDTPKPVGQTIENLPNGLTQTRTTYAMPQRGGGYDIIDTKPKPKLIEGQTGTVNGKRTIVKDGKLVYQ